jgi:glutamate/tyrosine decarboxylase-like PLP-dependent enzyme
MTTPAEDGTLGGLQLSADEMASLAERASELLLSRLAGLADQPAWQGASRDELEPRLRTPPPEVGRPAREVLDFAASEILPVASRVDHPRYFAFVPGAPTWPGVIADYLASGHNTFVGTWLGGSGPSMIELVVTEWFRDWIGYPESAGGLFTSGGSAASLDAFVAAREAAGGPERPSVYMSDQSHTALVRAATIVGVRPEHVRMIPTDTHFRVRMDALASAVHGDREAGLTPVAVCANAGATNTGAVDPMPAMADFCEAESLWLHVDAAYGGFGVLCEKGRAALEGLERADSIAMDAHKWLFQPFEAGCLMVKDVARLEAAFGVQPDYLQDTRWGSDHPNFSDRGLQLSRSFRALKVWMSVQTFGLGAFRRAVSGGIELAERAEEYAKSSKQLEVANPASLGVVCFRFNPEDTDLSDEELERINRAIQDQVISTGTAFMSSTRLRGRYSLRLCILNHNTRWSDVLDTLQAIERFGRDALRA